jgi:hypothetical protein
MPSATTSKVRPRPRRRIAWTSADGVGFDLVDEELVDLDDVDRKAAQIAQRGVAGSEIVEGETHTQRLDGPQLAGRLFDVVHQRMLVGDRLT